MDRFEDLARSRMFQQITSGTGPERALDQVSFGIGGQHQQLRMRTLRHDLPRGFDAIQDGHDQIHQHHVGAKGSGHLNSQLAIGGLAHDFQARINLEHCFQTFAHNGVVIDDQYFNSFELHEPRVTIEARLIQNGEIFAKQKKMFLHDRALYPRAMNRNAVLACAFALIFDANSASLPPKDERAGPPKTLNTPRSFPEISSRAGWEKRGREIRDHILVSCGLFPLPEKAPLNPRISGRVDREGYSIENVYIETYPGFFLAGNLYRPLGKGAGPFAGVLNPHGHWKEGRLADTDLGSIAARCINFARRGMVAFSYDMVGYNDTSQVNHKFASNPTNLLWNISLMGLQTWNSIRALDFLASLPEVDKKRLACTGESGGGTQTFMLGAIDDRLAVQAPIVMVSHSMQGGCLCENAPGLRVDHSNMEIAAVPAPRPQILVACTKDWTKTTMTVEGPAIASVYRLFGAEDKLRFNIFDYEHNYNQTTREAVYAWFGRHLLKRPDAPSEAELPYRKESNDVLRVFPAGKLPDGALNEGQLIASMNRRAKEQKVDKAALKTLWKHTLQVEIPEKDLIIEAAPSQSSGEYHFHSVAIGRAGKRDRLPVVMITPANDRLRYLAVLAHPEGKSAYLSDGNEVKGLAKTLLDRSVSVILVDTFLTGELANPEARAARKHTANHFSTYNRTDLQERVQDLITTCAFAQTHNKRRKVVLIGEGRAGIWALLAAPAADATITDADGLDVAPDETFLSADLFAPGILRLRPLESMARLVAPRPVRTHATAKVTRLSDAAIADWVSTLKPN
jgi:dienelactone hydrolase